VALAEGLIAEITREFPNFRLVPKRGDALSTLVDRLLKIVTLGRQRSYLAEYHTVIGSTLYTPLSWEKTGDVERAIVLRHERVHLRQRRRYGSLLMSFLYLIPFFPLGLAYGRARLEWEAYEETLRATADLLGLESARTRTTLRTPHRSPRAPSRLAGRSDRSVGGRSRGAASSRASASASARRSRAR
jgi:hypothetical protein